MKNYTLRIAAGFGIYILFLFLHAFYLLYKYRKQRVIDKSFFSYLITNEDFKSNTWILPIAIASIMSYNFFVDSSIYKAVVLVSTMAIGIDIIWSSLWSKNDSFEKNLKNKKVLLGLLIFLLLSVNIYWYKEAVKMFSAKYVLIVLTTILSIKLSVIIRDAIKTKKELKSVQGFYLSFGMTVFSFVLIIITQLL